MSTDVPVLMLVFNRPEKTRQVFEQVRAAKPSRLFVAADGPRPVRPEDAPRCAATRRIVDEVDWPCTVQTLFRDTNLGCKRGVESGITWFFSHVDAGIVLEDDCVPARSFFPYCAELLERYADHDDVMMVAGTNALGEWRSDRQSYSFSYNYNIWGWASWRRAWDHYDPVMPAWNDPEARSRVKQLLGTQLFRWWEPRLDSVSRGLTDTWDWVWIFALMLAGSVTATPARNLVTNIGFDQEATHTRNEWSDGSRLPTYELAFPLRHPASRNPDHEFDRLVHRRGTPLYSRLAALLPAGVREPARTAFHKLSALAPR